MEEIQSIDKDVDTHSIQLGKTPPTLTYFCVYNSSLSQSEENTKDQILYYTAKKVVPADVKMKQVGLAQALVNFTSAFSPSQLAQNVHTQKNRMVFLQPEEGFWIHMSIELGILRRHIKDSKGKEKLVTEYLDASLNDRALEAVLKVGYEQFRLLNGTFASLLYGEETSSPSKMPSRQHMRSLMHSIEEFFSDWIWKLDFDRLDTMVFSAVFNGVPSYPILRSTYMRVHELDQSIVDKFHSAIDHLVVLDADEGSLVYRSPSISINDVCALRKYILKRVEKGLAQDQEREKRLQERKLAASKSDTKMSGFKLLTKSFSHAQIFNYFSSSASKSNLPIHSAPISEANSTESIPSLPATSHIPPQPSSPTTAIPTTDMRMTQGKYLTGLVEDYCMDMDGEERCIARAEIVRVYLSSRSALENASTTPEPHDGLTEYFLVIYKHQSNLVWSFLLPSFSAEAQEMIVDASFYPSLENHLIDQHIEPLTATVLENMQTAQEKSLNLGKHYKCFYYDNATLNMKSTMVDQKGKLICKSSRQQDAKFLGGIPMTQDILLQLLEIKNDFESLPRTNEIYTRSVSNYWIAGQRVYNRLLNTKSTTEYSDTENQNVDGAPSSTHNAENIVQEAESRSSVDSLQQESMEDYTEIYLVAAKKDASLANVEGGVLIVWYRLILANINQQLVENLRKMTNSLLETMHLES